MEAMKETQPTDNFSKLWLNFKVNWRLLQNNSNFGQQSTQGEKVAEMAI